MSRIKCRYVAQLIVDIDTPYGEPNDRPIAEVKESAKFPYASESVAELAHYDGVS